MKKKLLYRIAAVVLIAALCVPVFAGCGNNADADGGGETPEFMYVPEYFEIDGEVQDISYVAYYDGALYFTSWTYEEIPIDGEEPGDGVIPPPQQPLAEGEGDDEPDTETQEEASGESAAAPATAQTLSASSRAAISRMAPMPARTSAPAEDDEGDAEENDESEEDTAEGEEEGGEIADEPASSSNIDYYPRSYGRSVIKLLKVNIDGTGLQELPNFEQTQIPEGMMGDSYIQSLTVDRDGFIWVQENVNSYIIDEDYNYSEESNAMYLRKLDNTGAEISRIDASSITGSRSDTGNVYIQSMQFDENGNVYFITNSYNYETYESKYNLIVLGGDGKELVNIESTSWIDQLIRLGDGRVGVQMYDEAEMKQVLRFVDLSKKDWGESIPVTGNIYNTMPGNDEYDLFYNDNSNLCGVNFTDEGSETTYILNWINSDIDSNNLRIATPLPDGRILCIIQTWDNVTYESKTELAMLTKTPYSEIAERQMITLATMYIDYNMRSEIIKFNKTNEKYRISVTEYQQFNDYSSEDGYNLGQTKLNAEIISGNVPDILIINSSMPVDQYASKGLFEDLYPYIDNDPELSRDDFVQNVMKTLEYDGKLVRMTPSFAISSYIGRAEVLGPESGITLDELMAAVDKNPGSRPFDFYYTRSQILSDCLSMGMDSYIDWATGKCSFDTPEFERVLEFAARFPETFDWEKQEEYPDSYADFRDGKQLLMNSWLYGFINFMYNRYDLGEDIVFKGFPTDSRDGHSLNIDSSFAITTKSAGKEGAWEFLRRYLMEEYQSGGSIYNFPSNKNALDKLAQEAMTEDYYEDPVTGEKIKQAKMSYWTEGSETPVEIYAMSQEDVDMIYGLINTVTRTQVYDESILGIITEEAEPFFAGQKTAAATADIIQNRVSLYINEQR